MVHSVLWASVLFFAHIFMLLLDQNLGLRCLNQFLLYFRTGELMNRLSSDSQVIQNAVTVSLFFTLKCIVTDI